MQTFRRLLLIAFLIALYLNIGLTIAGTNVGGIVAALFGVSLLFVHTAYQARPAAVRGATFLAIMAISWSLTIPFSPDPAGFLSEHLKSVLMLLVNSLAAFGAYCEIRTIHPGKLTRTSAYVTATLIFLAILEIYTPFRAVSDAVRVVLYGDRFIYANDVRDLLFAGGIRPNVFTQEPSHLAKAIAISLAASVILSKHQNRYLIGGLVWLLALVLTGSPTIMMAVGLVAFAHVFGDVSLGSSASRMHNQSSLSRSVPKMHRQHHRISKNIWRSTLRISLVFAPILAFAMLQQIAYFLPFERAQAIALGEDSSTITRSIGPASVALETIKQYPITGAGIGGRELVTDIVLDVYNRFPGYWLGRLEEEEGYAGWGNAFFEIPAYSGLFGGIILIPLLVAALCNFSPNRLLAFGCFFLVFNFDSGFVSMRPWGYFGVIMAVIQVAALQRRAFIRAIPKRGREQRSTRAAAA